MLALGPQAKQQAPIGLLALFLIGTLPTSTFGQQGGGTPPVDYQLLNGAGNSGFGADAASGLAPEYGMANDQAASADQLESLRQQQQQQQQMPQQQQWMDPISKPLPSDQPSWFIAPSEQALQPTEESAFSPTWPNVEPTAPSVTVQPPPTSAATPTTYGVSGIVNYLLSPLGGVYRHAKRLFSNGYENGASAVGDGVSVVSDGVDAFRLQTYKMFMQLYNKTYSPDEIPRRMALFFERRKQIEDSVKDFLGGKSLFYLRENDFTDWFDEELKKLTGLTKPSNDKLTPEERAAASAVGEAERESSSPTFTAVRREISDDESNNIEDDGDGHKMSVRADFSWIPASKDWRQSGCVSQPINQHKCGACYAIATVSVVETMRCIKKVASPILSPQEIVDCANSQAGYDNFGCDGGWPTMVLRYLRNVRKISRESCYPYVHRSGSCKSNQVRRTNGCTVNASPTDTSIEYKVLHNERDILYHVATTGPVVTVMQTTNSFLMYGKGIFDDWTCSNRRDDVDHAIVIVGYGKQNGVDYWLIKNSWGTKDWGEGGYGKYRRGKNVCSIGHWGWVVTR